MFTWITTFGIATGLAGVGAYVDKLVSIRHKSKLHLAMHRWWNRLDETKIPNYLHLLSFWISSRAEKLFYSNHWRMIVAYSIISWLLLTISILLEPFFLNLQGFQFVVLTPSPQQVSNLNPPDFFDKLQLPHALCFIPVFIFDFLTVMVTLKNLSVLNRHHGIWIVVSTIAFQALLISVFAICSFASVMYAQDFAINHNLIGMRYERECAEIREINGFNFDLSHQMISNATPNATLSPLSTNATVVYFHKGNSWLEDIRQSPPVIFGLLQGHTKLWNYKVAVTFHDPERNFNYSHDDGSYSSPSDLLIAGTVFLPALILTFMLTVMYLARFSLGVVRGVLMYFFDLATELDPKQFMPATLIGITFGLSIIIIKSTWEFYMLIHRQ